MAAFYNDREAEALAIDDIVVGMRRVIDQLPEAERKSSMRPRDCAVSRRSQQGPYSRVQIA
jgi:hypothetical protein